MKWTCLIIVAVLWAALIYAADLPGNVWGGAVAFFGGLGVGNAAWDMCKCFGKGR